MKYRLKTISPIQTSKVYAVVFLPLYLIYALFGFLMLLNPEKRGEGVVLVLTPIMDRDCFLRDSPHWLLELQFFRIIIRWDRV